LWQESVKTFTISLFLQDLVGPIISRSYNNYQLQTLEDLRGINIVNYEENAFFGAIVSLRDEVITVELRSPSIVSSCAP